MEPLNAGQIAALLEPYRFHGAATGPRLAGVRTGIHEQLAVYLALLLKWNERTNLTALRDPALIVKRHFGESLFASGLIEPAGTLLDFGSGAGFPGVPIALARPDLSVTLAESQGKKAAFLREVVRTLALKIQVWDRRVQEMPASRRFEVVALRAVDKMEHAVQEAGSRALQDVVLLGDGRGAPELGAALSEYRQLRVVPIPHSTGGVVWVGRRLTQDVPRGT